MKSAAIAGASLVVLTALFSTDVAAQSSIPGTTQLDVRRVGVTFHSRRSSEKRVRVTLANRSGYFSLIFNSARNPLLSVDAYPSATETERLYNRLQAFRRHRSSYTGCGIVNARIEGGVRYSLRRYSLVSLPRPQALSSGGHDWILDILQRLPTNRWLGVSIADPTVTLELRLSPFPGQENARWVYIPRPDVGGNLERFDCGVWELHANGAHSGGTWTDLPGGRIAPTDFTAEQRTIRFYDNVHHNSFTAVMIFPPDGAYKIFVYTDDGATEFVNR